MIPDTEALHALHVDTLVSLGYLEVVSSLLLDSAPRPEIGDFPKLYLDLQNGQCNGPCAASSLYFKILGHYFGLF